MLLDLTKPGDALRLHLLIRAVCRYNDTLPAEVQALTVDSVIAAQNSYEGDWKVCITDDDDDDMVSLDRDNDMMTERLGAMQLRHGPGQDRVMAREDRDAEQTVGQDSG